MNLNVEVNDSCIEDAIETLMERPLSEVKSDSEGYTDACIDELRSELTEYVDDSVTDRDSSDIDDLTMRLENLEETVKSLYMFKQRAASELLLVCKLRSVFREFMDHDPADDSRPTTQPTTIVCSNSYYGEENSNDELG